MTISRASKPTNKGDPLFTGNLLLWICL